MLTSNLTSYASVLNSKSIAIHSRTARSVAYVNIARELFDKSEYSSKRHWGVFTDTSGCGAPQALGRDVSRKKAESIKKRQTKYPLNIQSKNKKKSSKDP